jgi:hypothetical protein
MRLTPMRLMLSALLLATLAGCGTTQSCGGNQDYLAAAERPRLQLPPSMVASERIAPIVIPPAAADAQKLDPQPRCLDYPPPFFGSKKPPSSQPAAPSAAGEAAATPATAPPSAQAPAPSTEQSTGKP